ncbi:hypothetical protein HWV62_28777 [Athelia sp. TMB]|nr:hypothetical protein HWV62_28777 [Athelia sp. TMB]
MLSAIKLFDFVRYSFSPADNAVNFGRKWILADLTYCIALSHLRIPRLHYSKAVVVLQIISLCFMDGVMFGGIHLHLFGASTEGTVSNIGFSNRNDLPSTPEPFRLSSIFSPLGLLPFISYTPDSSDAHLLGQHTIHMSPISTAQLNPNSHTFCLSPHTSNTVLIPVLLNNTDIANLRYTITPLGYVEGESGKGKIDYVELSAKDLKAIEAARQEGLQVSRPLTSANGKRESDDYEYDEYDDEDNEAEDLSLSLAASSLQNTQSLVHIRLRKPGTVRLERVMTTSNVPARLGNLAEITVVPCPQAEFAPDKLETIRCAGQDPDLQLNIDIRGVPPLSLRWHKDTNGKREHFLVEGIEGGHEHHHHGIDSSSELPLISARGKARVPSDLKVPLQVTLGSVGRHTYVLEEVIDGVGNAVVVDNSYTTLAGKLGLAPRDLNATQFNPKTTRSVNVLRRPSMSFRNCGPGAPTSLLIGSEASLTVGASEADDLDAPWEVSFKYQPPTELDGKKLKPWTRTLTTEKARKDTTLKVTAPGEYTITGVQGKFCAGDVLAPESCKVVEKQRPTAEIDWKRIHECSGDTGVSASLTLHGSPPFQVYYRTQRDNEQARDLVKTFPNSRGELTLQPERSGHYAYTFLSMSDSNYKKVELNGPSIDQIVHPLAAAEFVNAGHGARSKKMINSCSGNLVDVEVELRGTGPWNVEVQVVGPKGSEILQIPGIKASRSKLQIPIPREVDQEGGSFDIELISVEDSYGCKRVISVPGITANVRRIKPTAKFYGTRQVTVLEQESAILPLRLTGDGPWKVKYRRVEAPALLKSASLSSQNAQLVVTEDGLYEIVEVRDSQCPGSVILEESTYQVNWIPKPSASLAPETAATYSSHNRSHVLPPICQGIDDHVDLDLTGRAPFQILYNIAEDDQNGGTNILEQPTFSSIQHRTRFQLHTITPGRKYYEVKQIGDSPYPLVKHKNEFIPRSQRLLFEQEVYARPAARFRNSNRISYCLNDALVPRDASTQDGSIEFQGTPPFEVQLSIKNLAASKVHTETIKVAGRTWTMSLPSYTFESIGPQLITIESVQDASHCEQATLDPAHRSIWVDRSEPSPKKGMKPGRVLETHTVTGVMTKEYSIFSALEGTWTVTSISDRYCRYPPAQPDGDMRRLTN